MFCRYCGTTISDDDVFCKQCGKQLLETPMPTQETVKTKDMTAFPLFVPTSDALKVSDDPIRVFIHKHSKLGWAIIGVTLFIVICPIVGAIKTQGGNSIS